MAAAGCSCFLGEAAGARFTCTRRKNNCQAMAAAGEQAAAAAEALAAKTKELEAAQVGGVLLI